MIKAKTVAKTDSDKTDSLTNEEWKPVDSATATKAWIEYATPGEMHKMLAKSDGNWSGGKYHVDGKTAGKPMISQSEVTNKNGFRWSLSGKQSQRKLHGNAI